MFLNNDCESFQDRSQNHCLYDAIKNEGMRANNIKKLLMVFAWVGGAFSK
jgi:hypothetical protein